jgi:XTP/dITP diphosphohydrolase
MLEVNNNRNAFWTSAIACYLPGKEIKTYVGKTQGTVPLTPGGTNGYMVDRIFVPEGQNLSIAEMDPAASTKMWNDSPCWEELLTYIRENIK